MASTLIDRKCRSCYYFNDGWCYWLGQRVKPTQNECDDGWKSYKFPYGEDYLP